jgi:hypothetical protein
MQNPTTTSGLALQHTALAKPPLHIPNKEGRPFKTEFVLERDPAVRTVRITWWHEDDDRGEPHNHPWDFKSEILFGGYTDDRYWVEDGKLQHKVIVVKAGDVNEMRRHEYHRVTNVLPGTVTRLTAGPAVPENEWGYLNTETLAYTRAKGEPDFLDRLRANNRFMLPKT